MEGQITDGTFGVNAIKEEHMKVNVEVQRAAEALHLRDGARARGPASESRLAYQIRNSFLFSMDCGPYLGALANRHQTRDYSHSMVAGGLPEMS